MYLKLCDASARFGPSEKTLRRLIKGGKLKATRFGGAGPYYVLPEDVSACFQSVPVTADPEKAKINDDRFWEDFDREFRSSSA